MERTSGGYEQGIYKVMNTTKEDILANVQPKTNQSMQDKDNQWVKSSLNVFSEDQIFLDELFNYDGKLYKVASVESYACTDFVHYEAVAEECEQ